MPAKTYDEIDANVTAMQAAGAPDSDIQQYVKLAVAELQAVQSSSPGAAAAPAEPALTDNLSQKDQPAAAPVGDPFLRMAQGLGMDAKAARETAPGAMRYGVPIAATIASGGMGAPLLLSSLIGGATAMAGEGTAQGLESGGIEDPGQIVKAGVLGSVPATRLIGGTGALRVGARIAGEGSKFAALEALGETARQSINQGTPTNPYTGVGDFVRKVGPAALIGSGFAGLGEIGGKLARAAASRTERLAAFAEAGIEKPTLDLIFPSQVTLVNRMAARSPEIAKLRLDTQRPLLAQFENYAANAPGNEAIYKQLRPYVGRIDDLTKEVAEFEQQAVKLREAAKIAAQDASVTPDMVAGLKGEATVAELNAINAKARALHETNANLSGFVDYDSSAKDFGKVVDRLFTTRKEIGAQRFAAANVPADVPIFSKEEMIATAKRGLERWRGTDLEKRILGAIEDSGGAEAGALTLNQFRELRTAFSDRFIGLDPRQIASAEAASRAAYGALTETSKKTIAALPGADIKAYNAALGYWCETAEAAQSRYARPLLSQEPNESTFQTLASDLAAGRKAEVRAFNEFVEAVAQDAPDVARLASQRLTQAVRNSFLGQARTPTGIDPKKLTDSLLKAQGQFEIGALGFGTPTDIRRWSDTLREFNLTNLADADLTRMFSDPAVLKAMGQGKALGDSLRPAVARVAFEQRVQEHALKMALGKRSDAASKASQALKAADAAGMTLAERKAVLAAVEADPVMQAFAGKQTWGIPSRPGDGGATDINTITNTMLNLGPEDGFKLVSALKQRNPDLADQVQRRVLADVLQKTFRPANSPGDVWALNKAEVMRFFNPKPGSNEAVRLETVKAMVGPDKLKHMQKILTAVGMVQEVERSAGILSTDGAKTIFASTGIGRDLNNKLVGDNAGGVIQSGFRSVSNLFGSGKYHILAQISKPGPWRDAFWNSGGSVQRAFETMGPQRALLLMRDPALQQDVQELREQEGW